MVLYSAVRNRVYRAQIVGIAQGGLTRTICQSLSQYVRYLSFFAWTFLGLVHGPWTKKSTWSTWRSIGRALNRFTARSLTFSSLSEIFSFCNNLFWSLIGINSQFANVIELDIPSDFNAELIRWVLCRNSSKPQTWNERQKVPQKVLGITNEDNRKEGGKEKT